MVSHKQKKEIEDMSNFEEELRSSSEESFDRDIEFASRSNQYSSDDIPTDIYRYKRMRLIPNSEAEFRGLLDKDVVLANVKDKKPDPEYLKFIAETIVAMDIFSLEIVTNKYDSNGNPVMVKDDDGKLVFDKQVVHIPNPEFDIIRNILRAGIKADLTLSRAMGKDREAVLDRTQGFSKEIKRPDRSNKYG